MKIIELDGSAWSEELDFWYALREALGVSRGHGTGFDAFVDSIFYHPEMLEVPPPFTIEVKHPHPTSRADVERMAAVLAEAREWRKANYGDDVEALLRVAL